MFMKIGAEIAQYGLEIIFNGYVSNLKVRQRETKCVLFISDTSQNVFVSATYKVYSEIKLAFP